MKSQKKQIVISIIGGLSLLCIMSGAPYAQTTLPALEHVDWLVLGPFDLPVQTSSWGDVTGFHADYLTEIGGETHAQPTEGQDTQGKAWKRLRAPGLSIDLLQVFGMKTNCVAYAYTEFESPVTQQAALKLGSDDGVKVWLNGELLLSHNVGRSLNPDDEALVVTIRAGTNRLLLKIGQGEGDWSFGSRFRSLEEEQQTWANTASPRLAVRPLDKVVINPEDFSCTVMTIPTVAVQEPITLEIQDMQGKMLLTTEGQTSTLVSLPLSKDFSGPAILRVTGQGRLAQVTIEEPILFGNPETIGRSLIRQARDLAEQVTHLEEADDLKATLLFYADVLEGKGHPTLTSVSYRLAAIETLSTFISLIATQTWNAEAFRGLHHWAYRSAIDESLQPYSLYVPKTYNASKAYPLIVVLHWYTGEPVSAMRTLAIARLQPEDFIVVAPFARGDMGYFSIGEQDVLDVLEKIQTRFHIDPDRIYLVGWSMGGLGTWRIGQHFADKFAAIAPFAGWTGTQYLENLHNLSVFAVHGDVDRSVSVRYDREAAEYLQTLNYSIHYEELPGGSHDAWGDWIRQKSGGEERLLEYFRTQRRNPWPEEVVLKTNYIRYGQQYWVRLIELANPPQDGLIQAKLVNPSQIIVATEQVSMFALNFDHPQLSRTSPVIVEIDGSRFEIQPQQGEVFFQLGQDNQWMNVVDDRPEMVPHYGGGAADIMVRPMLIVYGTQQRGKILKKAAELFADWSPTPQVRIGCKAGQFRVKADTDITEADLQQYHLLLFGGPEENVITQRIAEKLPVRITATGVTVNGQEFQQAGVSLTYPNPLASRNLIGILMLPFPDAEITAAMPYMGLQFFAYQVAQRATDPAIFPDVLVFNSLGFNRQTVLWIGWFDHTWQNLRGAGS